MTQYYVGTKQVMAWPQDKDGSPGYAVKYEDGYTSWSPQETFEAAYFPMGEENDGTRVTPEMVAAFVRSIEFVGRHGNHAVYLVTLANGFTLIEESACVHPENFDEAVARGIVEKRVEKHVYHLLGFALSWGRKGLVGG